MHFISQWRGLRIKKHFLDYEGICEYKKKGAFGGTLLYQLIVNYLPYLTAAWAAASLAMGTLKGEQLT